MAEKTISTLTNVAACAALLALTAATTALGRMDLGGFNLPVALAIAAAKGFVIALYFMHIRWEHGVVRLAAAGGLLWLAILLLGTLDDYATRAWLAIPGK
jgi:cytochrome c oxidase subunit 4